MCGLWGGSGGGVVLRTFLEAELFDLLFICKSEELLEVRNCVSFGVAGLEVAGQ